MNTPVELQDGQAVRDAVRTGYASIASGERTLCCGPSCCGSDPGQLARAIGYDVATLEALPDGADMGLSCGNPIAIASLTAGEVVLDLGSGGGFDVFQAGPKVGTSGRVIGVDMTPEMLSKARRNVEHYRKNTGLDNVEFRLGEIEHLPVPDAAVDVVISNCVINLSPNKPQVWREIFRVLKPGGRIAVSDLALLQPLPSAIQKNLAALVGCVAGAALIDDIKAGLESAGFSSIQLTPKLEYVRQMQEWQDPVYKELVESLPGGQLTEYLVSLNIEAQKKS